MRRLSTRPLQRSDDQDDEYVVEDLIDSIEDRTCGYCGNQLPTTTSARNEYCDDVCRQSARRRRLAHASARAARANATERP